MSAEKSVYIISLVNWMCRVVFWFLDLRSDNPNLSAFTHTLRVSTFASYTHLFSGFILFNLFVIIYVLMNASCWKTLHFQKPNKFESRVRLHYYGVIRFFFKRLFYLFVSVTNMYSFTVLQNLQFSGNNSVRAKLRTVGRTDMVKL